jgi:hypothetical protein
MMIQALGGAAKRPLMRQADTYDVVLVLAGFDPATSSLPTRACSYWCFDLQG